MHFLHSGTTLCYNSGNFPMKTELKLNSWGVLSATELICNENPGKVNLAFRNNSGLERIFRPSAGLMWAVVTVSCSECEIMPSEPETHLLPEIVAQSRKFLLPGRKHSHPYQKWGRILMGVEMGPLLYGIEGWNARKDDDGLVDECQKQWVADTTPCHSQSTLTILVSCNSFYVTFLLWI